MYLSYINTPTHTVTHVHKSIGAIAVRPIHLHCHIMPHSLMSTHAPLFIRTDIHIALRLRAQCIAFIISSS